MKEKNKITEEELIILNNLNIILNKYNIPKEKYLISETYQNSEHVKICLTKTPIGKWNTCLKIQDGIFDSIYHSNLTTAIIKFIQYIAPNDEQSIIIIKDFLNHSDTPLSPNRPIKYLRKKR